MPPPAELTPLQDPDADPVALWRILARMPKDAKKAFRTGAVTIPYTTGVVMLQVAPNVPSAQVHPNLAAVLTHTETSEVEQLVGLAWNLFVRNLDPDAPRFRLSDATTVAFGDRVSRTLGTAPNLVVSKNQYRLLRRALVYQPDSHCGYGPRSVTKLPAARRQSAADTLVWLSSTNDVSEPQLPTLLRCVTPTAWQYVSDTVLEAFAKKADFIAVCVAREAATRMNNPDRSPLVEKAFAHIPEQLRPSLV